MIIYNREVNNIQLKSSFSKILLRGDYNFIHVVKDNNLLSLHLSSYISLNIALNMDQTLNADEF